MNEELDSLQKRDTVDEVTSCQLVSTYWSKGVRAKTIPAKLVTVKQPLHAGDGG